VWEKVELLKNHSDSSPNFIGMDLWVGNIISSQPDLTIVDLFQKIDASEER